ncbi:hypothetical protein VPH35_065777 [Triticum aestivum]
MQLGCLPPPPLALACLPSPWLRHASHRRTPGPGALPAIAFSPAAAATRDQRQHNQLQIQWDSPPLLSIVAWLAAKQGRRGEHLPSGKEHLKGVRRGASQGRGTSPTSSLVQSFQSRPPRQKTQCPLL